MAITKAELQTQLRELNRGYPRMPVSKMKVHELEAAIDAAKKMKGEAEGALATKTPALPGPKGPREIPIKEVESGDVVIHAPQMPAARGLKKAVVPKLTISALSKDDSEDEDHGPPAPKKKVQIQEPEKKKAEKPVEKKPKVVKAQSEATSSSSHAAPSVPHKSLPTHYCNCPSCPTKNKKA
jgi:hypothetical protein